MMSAEDNTHEAQGVDRLAMRWLIGLTSLGVVIRFAFLLLSSDLEPFADESNYLYLASVWNRFSVYSGGLPYLWPPGYPFILTIALNLFGENGIFAVKLCQVLLSGVIGSMIMLFSARLFSGRAARLAGLIWCFYLPLIGFSHYLWPETVFLCLFLPGFYLLLRWWQALPRGAAKPGMLVAAGVLIGFSLLFKEVCLWWSVLIGVLIMYHGRALHFRTTLSNAFLFWLAISVVVVPWTMRNYEVYERFVPVGATLGKNVSFGMNAFYINFDYPGQCQEQIAKENGAFRKMLTQPVSKPWKQSTSLNVIDKSSENAGRGMQYAMEHPGFMLQSRIKRIADWISPISFFVRHYGNELYQGVLNDPVIRKVLISMALVLPLLIMMWATGGICLCLKGSSARSLIIWTLLYFALSGALIAGISRYRIVIEPILIGLAAAFICRNRKEKPKMSAAALCIAGWVVLLGLWSINAIEVFYAAKCAW